MAVMAFRALSRFVAVQRNLLQGVLFDFDGVRAMVTGRAFVSASNGCSIALDTSEATATR